MVAGGEAGCEGEVGEEVEARVGTVALDPKRDLAGLRRILRRTIDSAMRESVEGPLVMEGAVDGLIRFPRDPPLALLSPLIELPLPPPSREKTIVGLAREYPPPRLARLAPRFVVSSSEPEVERART